MVVENLGSSLSLSFASVKSVKSLKESFRKVTTKHPEKFYPVNVLKANSFVRKQCKVCGRFFWTTNPEEEVCGDATCNNGYSFINNTPAKAKLSYVDVWNAFKKIFEEKGYKPIKRYPVVARWRADTDFVQASIYDFQPYVVSGEVQPPAEKLVVPQTCLRFNDIENVGLTGAHYTGFVMIGQHAFMPANNWDQEQYFQDIYDWLVKGLKIPVEEIKFHEDAWAGGGNLGPSMEFFARGLELGNQVYMMFETRSVNNALQVRDLKLKVLDMGMGHERNAWFSLGEVNSYEAVFPKTLAKLKALIGIQEVFNNNKQVLTSFYSRAALLNKDESKLSFNQLVKDLCLTKEQESLILKLKALYSIVDHARALLWAINDGALPSNVGGGYNLRVILRRALSLIIQYKFDISLQQVITLIAKELKPLFPEFVEEYEHVNKIVEVEKNKYFQTRKKNKAFIERLVKTSKQLTTEKLLELYTTKGITPQDIEEEANLQGVKIEIPANFFEALEAFKAKTRLKARKEVPEQELIDLLNKEQLPETEILYWDHYDYVNFEARVLKHVKLNIDNQDKHFLILDRTAFYPTSGGQDHDEGFIKTKQGVKVKVLNVFKHGKWIVHELKPEPNQALSFKKGDLVYGSIDFDRRQQLTQHHTATHILNGACQRVLGKHVWQAGAYKGVTKARLDITHYDSITDEELKKIEKLANQVILENRPVYKYFLDRAVAEQKFGMRIYQGGAVPGKVLRIVEIKDFDVEACAGTHLDVTSDCWKLRILKTSKIQDGVVRIEFVAGKAAKIYEDKKHAIADSVAEMLNVHVLELPSRVEELFNKWKLARKALKKQNLSKQEIESIVKSLELKKREVCEGDWEFALNKAASIVRTQPELLPNTVQRFLKQLYEAKQKLLEKIKTMK